MQDREQDYEGGLHRDGHFLVDGVDRDQPYRLEEHLAGRNHDGPEVEHMQTLEARMRVLQGQYGCDQDAHLGQENGRLLVIDLAQVAAHNGTSKLVIILILHSSDK